VRSAASLARAASIGGVAPTGDRWSENVFDLELVERVIAIAFKRPDAQDLYAVTDEGVLRAAVWSTPSSGLSARGCRRSSHRPRTCVTS